MNCTTESPGQDTVKSIKRTFPFIFITSQTEKSVSVQNTSSVKLQQNSASEVW